MKNLILFLSALTFFACKKQEEVITNKLIAGLDPSVALPKADTTGAFAYFQGYIDGEYFSIVQDKDSFQMIDVVSYIFGSDYKKEWFQSFPDGAIGALWLFQQPETMEKRWFIKFNLPAYSSLRGENDFINYKKKHTSPNTFTNIGSGNGPSNFDEFKLEIFRDDIYSGKPNTIGVSTDGENQSGSYIKLISVRYVDYVPNTNWHYEMTYEIDLKLTGGKHLTKGRMKTWLTKIKL